MIIFLLLTMFFPLRAEVWTQQQVDNLIHAKPKTAVNNSYLDILCETQLREHRVPSACYRSASPDEELLRFLDGRCNSWIEQEKDIERLENWLQHPKISAQCHKRMNQRLIELLYVQEEQAPAEYFRARKIKLAQKLNKHSRWKKKFKPTP